MNRLPGGEKARIIIPSPSLRSSSPFVFLALSATREPVHGLAMETSSYNQITRSKVTDVTERIQFSSEPGTFWPDIPAEILHFSATQSRSPSWLSRLLVA